MVQSAQPLPPHAAGAVLTVDLDAVCDNYRHVAKTATSAEVAAVVKADAYGLGADGVAPALAAAGCRSFFVALPQEGADLRRVLPDAAIAVFNGPDSASLPLFRTHNLIAVLNTPAQIALWRDTGSDSPPAMLHIDTGMSRLGLAADELAQLAANPAVLAGVTVAAVLSHLACAEDTENPLNEHQRQAFVAALDRLAPTLPGVRASLANSSGVFLGPPYHFDMVRPGAALYGLAPLIGHPNPMRQAIEFKAKILQVRDVDTPMTVGYGATHRVSRRGRVATVAAGYADGYPRSLGNCGQAFIEDTAVPVIGRVSMDLITIDVTGLPAERARPGTMVELIGQHARTDAVADLAGTIGYELLTRLGHRSQRLYRGGGPA